MFVSTTLRSFKGIQIWVQSLTDKTTSDTREIKIRQPAFQNESSIILQRAGMKAISIFSYSINIRSPRIFLKFRCLEWVQFWTFFTRSIHEWKQWMGPIAKWSCFSGHVRLKKAGKRAQLLGKFAFKHVRVLSGVISGASLLSDRSETKPYSRLSPVCVRIKGPIWRH